VEYNRGKAAMSDVPEGYKMSEVGVIPVEWEVKSFGEICKVNQGLQIAIKDRLNHPVDNSKIYITIQYLNNGKDIEYINNYSDSVCCAEEDVLMTRTGNTGMVVTGVNGVFHNNFFKINLDKKQVDRAYVIYYLKANKTQRIILLKAGTSTIPDLNHNDFYSIRIPLPPLPEQQAIASALSDVDALITTLEQLITKKRNIKQGAMQQLITGKKRLPGFGGEWEVLALKETTDCLDHLRVPLNDAKRSKMQGDYPYCGANGILDYVNDYIIDNDIILIAEDGGYFDEYSYRPIAYRMVGKCWVNNHAHILKAKEGFNQNFIFYSLVHKNILRFLASGTRAKLNKSEMYKIEIDIPEKKEQQVIAQILSDMDTEIEALEQKRDKYKAIKQGMMQELLTGERRLA
jgi:type I restriction enzyme S subunit